MGLNIDAEEADRLDLSLDIIEAVLRDDELAGWDGFGIVVQAYSKRCAWVIDWLAALAETLDRKIMVRLVKGAYWDSEIKLAQQEGTTDFPVYTKKAATDVAYISCARKLLGMTNRIYPQFATHNAHTVAAILELADDKQSFEFQRLHGMGEQLHQKVLEQENTRCRIYAPSRRNAKGWDLHCIKDLAEIETARAPYKTQHWQVRPLVADGMSKTDTAHSAKTIYNPANPSDVVGTVIEADQAAVDHALDKAKNCSCTSAKQRASILRQAADLYESHFGELFAALSREAGKAQIDVISELREAIDFLRYYAAEAEGLADSNAQARGIVACISPWNFPLAIFTGQLSAALAAGNGVIAKPAEQTPITAFIAVRLLLKAGVPASALQLLPGEGAVVGSRLTSDPRIAGVCFTGSTATAQIINKSMAKHLDPSAMLIAETSVQNLHDLASLEGIDAVALWQGDEATGLARRVLASRSGAILPLITDASDLKQRCVIERHICIDTTAAGGNASLLAASA